MTTYLTTDQCVELAIHTDIPAIDNWPHSVHALCNAAIAAYLDSLAEGLPEPVAEYVVRTDSKGKTNGLVYVKRAAMGLPDGVHDLLTRDQPLQCIARANGEKKDEVGINGLTEAETNATMSVRGLSKPKKITAYEKKCFNDWRNP